MIKIKRKNTKKKMRVNITVDKDLLDKAKSKLNMFGGKVSTLFNSYLRDFVNSMEKNYSDNYREQEKKIRELEDKIKKIENEMEDK